MYATNLSRIAMMAGRMASYDLIHISSQASTSKARLALPATTSVLSRCNLPVSTRVRTYATRKFQQASITESRYHELANTCLDALTDSLETLVEEVEGPEADTYEAEYASGVLNLRLGSHGTYVINKQPPNKQIWFSSPRSGPKRFDYDAEHKAWFMLKDGEESNLRDLLNGELSDVFGKTVEVDLGEESL